MANNRSRGRRGELEAARVLGGERVSRTGQEGSDITDAWGFTWEVKRIKAWTRRIRDWYEQADRQGDFGVIVREDRGRWYVIIEADKYMDEKRGRIDGR